MGPYREAWKEESSGANRSALGSGCSPIAPCCGLALEEVEAQGQAAMRGVPSLLGGVGRKVRQPNPPEAGLTGEQAAEK